MRITFRAKIFLTLVLTVAAILGGALLAVERSYAAKVDELIAAQVRQGQTQFQQLTLRQRAELARRGQQLASSQRFVSCLENEEDWPKAVGEALYEMEYRGVEAEFLVIAGPEGKPIARRAGGREIAKDPGAESDLVKRAMAGEENLHGFIVDGGRLFQIVALGLYYGDTLQGAIVLGREINDAFVRELHALQSEHDHVGFSVDGRVLATSGPAEGPYHVVETPIHPRAKASLHISLRSLLEFRKRTRQTVLYLALAAVALSLILSTAISRGISKPVRDLVAGTERVAKGDYAHRIEVRSRDELGDLAKAFNGMAQDLANQEKVRGVLNKVVSRDVAEELLQGDLGLGGRLLRATLLFADLRGFTKLTQNMDPQDVVGMLNEFMTEMSAEIFACKGIVDKYVGDEIIGVFGAPKSYGHDSFAAIESAHRMRMKLAGLNGARARRGLAPLAMGIGIHTGEVVAGCMGSQQLMSYTCIGAAMNLAARLCSAAQPGQILVSEPTLREAGGDVEARPLPPIQVKGFTDPVPVFEIMSVMVGETDLRRKGGKKT